MLIWRAWRSTEGRLDHTTCVVARVGPVAMPARESTQANDVWEWNLFLPLEMKAEGAPMGHSPWTRHAHVCV